jgi:hypothetical protein
MNDAEQLAIGTPQLVRVMKALARLHATAGDQPRIGWREVEVLAPKQRERNALEILHRDVVLAFPLAELEHLADVGVRDACGDARFVEEHRYELRIFRKVRQDPLDADELLETAITVEPREEDLGHAARR